MLFNSFIFLFVFLPITWILFRFACAKHTVKIALAILMVASLVFYSYWNPPFLFLILFSILFNFSWGRCIAKTLDTRKRKALLMSGVAVNLFLIAYFKYANFLMGNLAWLFHWEWTSQEIFLPLGISFFTFQQIAYLIDCSKGLVKEHRFVPYALFVSFFPQLIAGPIVRYEEIMPQFSKIRTYALHYSNIAMGIALLSLGLFKKTVIADTLSPWVGAVFDSDNSLTLFEALIGVLAYTFQIYFDFSGYSDMALGLGRLFNIELPINFNSPYKALSVSDFWRRWHISLSTFLKDYLYIPLGGSRKGEVCRNVNLMATMLLGGLWHGASWNFVVWGGLHGLFLIVNHAYKKISSKVVILSSSFLKPLYWFFTFFSVSFAWVFFRATSFNRSWEIIFAMFGGNGAILPANYVPFSWLRNILIFCGVEIGRPAVWAITTSGKELISFLMACFFVVIFLPNGYQWVSDHFEKDRFSVWWAVGIGVLLTSGIGALNRVSEFLYFQF